MTIGVEDGWDDNMPAPEQLALTGFAAYLQSYVKIDKIESETEEDVREQAQLLLSLLQSASPSPQRSHEEHSPYATYPYEAGGVIHNGTLSFTCPLLSLDRSSRENGIADGSQTRFGDTEEDTGDSVAPAMLLGRKLAVEDPEKLRSSAEAIARNAQQSFHKAVQWRIQQWIYSLSCRLVAKEKELMEDDASEETLRELLDTPEARLLLCLRKAMTDIKVIDTSTTFQVLSQRINRGQGGVTTQSGAPPLKKRKVEVPASLQTETEYKYTVAHVLSFEAVMNLSTPAGYTEVTIEAPGIIEGTFLSSDMGEDILTGVSVELDTNVLAAAMERSSRIVARAATHAVIPSPAEEKQEETPKTKEHAPSPTQDTQTSIDDAAIVTPCKSTPTRQFTEKDGYVPIPDDLDGVRLVSPQPQQSPEYKTFTFTPRTPTANKMSVPNLVSPQPSSAAANEEPPSSPPERKSPSLPALVQVACAAMYAC